MYALSRFSVTQTVLVNLLTVIVIATGFVAMFILPRELFPMVSTDFIFVTTIYPRASADEIEKTITVLIEEEISDVRGIKTLRSTTVEGRSVILAEVDVEVEKIEKIQRDIENEVDKVVPDLPIEAEKPVVTEFVFDFPIITVSVAGAVTEHELKQVANNLKDELKRVSGVSDVSIAGEREEELWVEVDPLRLYGYGLTLEDVRRAVQMGGVDLAAGLARSEGEEFIVRTKELYDGPIDLQRVVLKAEGDGGRVRIADIADVRDTFEEATNIGRLQGERTINLDVKQRPGGDSIRIVAGVRQAIADYESKLPHGITAKSNRDISFMVRERLELLTTNGLMGLVLCLLILRLFLSSRMALMTGLGIPFAMTATIALMLFTDTSLNMISMFALIIVLGMLVDDGIVVAENIYRYRQMGADPVTAAIKGSGEVFWPVVGAVTTTIAAFIPILFMTGIMGKFCRPIPIVVSIALLASLVEALIVLPSHLAEWGTPRNWLKPSPSDKPLERALRWSWLNASLEGVPALVKPILLARRFLLFVIFLPVCFLFRGLVAGMRTAQRMGQMFDSSVISPNYWFPKLLKRYTHFLFAIIRNRLTGLYVVVAILGGAFVDAALEFKGIVSVPFMTFGLILILIAFIMSAYYRVLHILIPILAIIIGFGFYIRDNLKFQLFKNDDFSFFLVNLELPAGARLERTEDAIRGVEDYLLSKPKDWVEAVITRVGFIERADTGQMEYGSHKAQIIVDLTDSKERPFISGQDVLDDVRDHFPEFPNIGSIEFMTDSGGPPVGAAVTFRIMGEEYDSLLVTSEEVQDYLRSVEGVKDIRDDFEWGKEEFRIDVDEVKAADLGIDVADVATEVRNAFAGGLATTFTRGKEDVEIYVKFTEPYRAKLDNIRLMKFRNRDGHLVPFESFAQVVYGQSISVVQRWNQKRAVTVTADVDDRIITSYEINQQLLEKYGTKSVDHPGVTFDYGGEEQDSQESMAALGRAFGLAMFVNYAIIATIFNSILQPFVVLSVVPLSLIGVLIGLFVHNEPLGFMGLLGAVALVGIVVNNAILVIDFVNNARKRGYNRWRSLIWGSSSRVRPIILTTGTTIAGLFPMLFGLSGTSSFLVPLAISIVYGLAFSTTLTLLVVPLFMAYLDDLKEYFGFSLVRGEYDEELLNQDFHTEATVLNRPITESNP